METVKIAGISVRVDYLATFTYEQLFKMAVNSPKYYGKPNAKELIKKELIDNGFKPSKEVLSEDVADKPVSSRKPTKRKSSSKSRRNSSKSKS